MPCIPSKHWGWSRIAIGVGCLRCLEFTGIEALSGDIGDYDVIIGMDIITLGDFVITNKDNQT